MKRSALILLLSVITLSANDCPGQIRLASLFGDNMVIQRDCPVPMWGWADPGQDIRITCAERCWQTKAGKDGRWMTKIGPFEAGGPYELTIQGQNSLALENVLAGEVWLCSGQSNMEMPVAGAKNAGSQIDAADYPGIRLFRVSKDLATVPRADCFGRWKVCTPDTVADFSAVAYYFGRKIHQDVNVPVGLIDNSWGGSIAECWVSRDTIYEDPDLTSVKKFYEQRLVSPEMYDLLTHAEQQRSRLQWQRYQSLEFTEMPRAVRRNKTRHSPTLLYNAMLKPLMPYRIRGVIWYQGEGNRGRACEYYPLFRALIKNWRAQWQQGDFPFYYVQLANFDQPGSSEKSRLAWPELRQAQFETLSVKNTGMAVTVDIGDPGNVHFANKQDVGKRLALWALAGTYSRYIVYSGPLFESSRKENNRIILSFDHVDGGLATRGNQPLKGFQIAGADRVFVEAQARIEADKVVVKSPRIDDPVAVRYGWTDNPQGNLYNAAGLPASPFKTDNWPGLTCE